MSSLLSKIKIKINKNKNLSINFLSNVEPRLIFLEILKKRVAHFIHIYSAAFKFFFKLADFLNQNTFTSSKPFYHYHNEFRLKPHAILKILTQNKPDT